MLQGVQNAGNMVANANKLRQQQANFQKILSSISVTGYSTNKKVTVIMDGNQKVKKINFDPSLFTFAYENFFGVEFEDEEDMKKEQEKGQNFLTKPIIEAMEDAITKVQAKIVEEIQKNGSMGDLMSMLQNAA
jgi:DNA-binding protein YbaB